MNGEQISKALEFLEDDLVVCADEVRRGKRSFFRSGARWAAVAAACAAVVAVAAFVVPPAVSEDSALNGMIQQPGYSSSSNTEVPVESTVEQETAPILWREVSLNSILLAVPTGWNVDQEGADGDGAYAMTLEHEGKVLTVGYDPGFAVCGTGLEFMDVRIAGRDASVGYYDGSEIWSFISLGDDFVVINHAGDEWDSEERDEIIAILNTIVCMSHSENHDSGAGEDHPHTEGHHSGSKDHH